MIILIHYQLKMIPIIQLIKIKKKIMKILYRMINQLFNYK